MTLRMMLGTYQLETLSSIRASHLFLFGCSSGLYHIDINIVIAGMRSASKPPNKNRQTKRPAKLEQVAMHKAATPQKNTLTAKKSTAGNLRQSMGP